MDPLAHAGIKVMLHWDSSPNFQGLQARNITSMGEF